ncbi:MAG TPA: LEA type 2 family protein [Bacteroidia bacterium]|jgi:LEA14-like dessication related protein|nr:LEA type 2 family protein [Bacteroidia bacterium]
MNKFRFIIFSILIFLFNSCKEFKEIEVTGVKSFRLTKVNQEGIEGEVILGIKNPNSVGFSIYPSEFDVVYSGIKMGKARLHKRVHISGNSEKLYVFKLKTSLKDMNLMDVMGLLNGGKAGRIEAKGDLKAGKFYLKKRIPVNISEKIDLGG